MNSVHFSPGTAVITRISDKQWHALDDDRVVGRGDVSRRPDGRIFLSIDSWHGAVFDQLAATMLTTLPAPLYTVVDEADLDLTASWQRAGFTTRRREWEYLVPTDPLVTGLDSALSPEGVHIVPMGKAQEGPLREVYDAIRAEVDASVGWDSMPAEVLVRPDGTVPVDPAKYAVAAQFDRYIGLVRVVRVTRLPRIGLLAVRADQHRRGIARALLAHVLEALRRAGIETASAEVNESNTAAVALFDSVGAERVSSNLELVRH
ncbi:GNAT family N-acetyltransferase [Fodinicola feengrottensis]|uniref:GNAT family N-acetyltransferase n=1 Tax=Fodinicola feengrottensis TaxID=435914 RepID=A0ABN2IYF6_9ACTN|nr:GNAT family N-acetyltransferase [Fodinicola feengrottensis]